MPDSKKYSGEAHACEIFDMITILAVHARNMELLCTDPSPAMEHRQGLIKIHEDLVYLIGQLSIIFDIPTKDYIEYELKQREKGKFDVIEAEDLHLEQLDKEKSYQ